MMHEHQQSSNQTSKRENCHSKHTFEMNFCFERFYQKRCVGEGISQVAADVVVLHVSAKSHAAPAAKEAARAVVRAEGTKRAWLRRDVPDQAAFQFMAFAVGTCGYMCKEAVRMRLPPRGHRS